MTTYRTTRTGLALLLAVSLAACGDGGTTVGTVNPDDGAAADKPVRPIADRPVASPGKPTAPISLDYEIVNQPIVGAPVQINVNVASGEGPVKVRYSIDDESALYFQADQVEEEEISAAASRNAPRQIRVVPQREGRVYVNVSAELETPGGAMIRSMAIPLRVGAAPDSAPASSRDAIEGPDGEAVISMPAEEREN
jgi:hypothetical protein